MANVRKKQIEQADDAKGAAAGQEVEQSTKQKVLSEVGKRTGMSALTAGFRTTDPNVKSPRQQRKQARIERDKRNEAIVEEQRAKNEAGFEKANAFAVADDEDYAFLTSDEYDIEDEPVVEEEEEEEIIETKRSKLRKPKGRFTMKTNNYEGDAASLPAMVERHHEYFRKRNTISRDWRSKALNRLHATIANYTTPLLEALSRDLGISKYEAFLTEVAPLMEEFRLLKKHFESWTGDNNLWAGFKLLPTRYKTHWQPYGTVLIINSWQSPVLETITALADALAAGNSVVVETSSRTWRCNEVLSSIIAEIFKPDYVQIMWGDEKLDNLLVGLDFDMIYYCGEREQALKTMEYANPMAAKTMLLDGANSCFVDRTADISMAAERIMWGKMIHAGQTRLSPSFVFVSDALHKSLINRMYEYVKTTYGDNPIEAEGYPRMASKKEYDEACAILDHLSGKCEIVFGGERNEKRLRIAPTVILVSSLDDPIFKKKIVGPILPVFAYSRGDDAFDKIRKLGAAPAFYLFTKSKSSRQYALRVVDFGGGCINDTMIQIFNRKTGRAGAGDSGTGAMGGRAGVRAFGTETVVARSNKWIKGYRKAPYPESVDSLKRKFRFKSSSM